MINKKFLKLFFASTVVMASLNADDITGYSNYSLVGIEAGYGSVSSEIINTNTTPISFKTNDTGVVNIGLKLGAQSEHYRIFLSGHYGKDTDSVFDYIASYEAEIDYMFNFSHKANFFIGAHTGMSYMKFIISGEPFSRTISTPYYGGNVGFNIHTSHTVDLELGARFSVMNADNTKSGVKYQFNDMTTGYFSLIFKYQMD